MPRFKSNIRSSGFTLIELLVVIAIIALLIGILLPSLNRARLAGRKAVASSGQRQTLIGMNTFGGDNDTFYPGVTSFGGPFDRAFEDASNINDFTQSGGGAGRHIPARYLLMLQNQYIDAEVIVSPAENRPYLTDVDVAGIAVDDVRGGSNLSQPVWVDYKPGGWESSNGFQYAYTHKTIFYSYALLDLFNQDNLITFEPLLRGWSTEAGSETPIMSDRLLFWTELAKTNNQQQSLWVKDNSGWQGNIGFGDAHVEWKTEPVLQRTRFGQYVAEGANNANNNSNGPIDRSGDNIFKIDTGFGKKTQDVGMVVGWGSQTFRTGSSRNVRN